MYAGAISFILQTTPCPETPWFVSVLTGFVLPIGVAILTYLAVNWLGESQKRKSYSRLGIAIIESLQEEIKSGIKIMTDALDAANNPSATEPPVAIPPRKSWSGMSTISDDVLLRIIETSVNRKFDGFPLRECRIHCKNYFDHMCQNYDQVILHSYEIAHKGQNWRQPIIQLLASNTGKYIEAATKVDQMLEHSKQLLDNNSKAVVPK